MVGQEKTPGPLFDTFVHRCISGTLITWLAVPVALLVQGLEELPYCQPRFRDQTAKRAPCNFRVIGYRESGNVAGLRHNDMAALLPNHVPIESLEGRDNLGGRENGKRWHYTATSTCRVVTVSGIPISARTSKHCLIAS